jgi:predicted negative regulator of RcsB-dependent stress response
MSFISGSDNEQIQIIKDWWKQYGNSILLGIVIFAVINFGWRYWQQYQHQYIERASITYAQMSRASEQQKDDEVKLYAERLIQNYNKSPYAGLAALKLAKIAVQKHDLKLAREQLQFVITKSSNNALRQIARIRAARILLSEKQPQAALDLLATIDNGAYLTEVNEISGDALSILGKVAEAKQAYQNAKDTETGETKSPLLKLKMRQF